ncbi:GTP-binding protein [Limnobacter sp.]|uniref:GTP-binding protein n=1 Tax=Limnobacter sp. TaxID=2003368 RepID=UPI003515175A
MKTQVRLVPGTDPWQRALRIEQEVQSLKGLKTTLLLSGEVFQKATVEQQATLFAHDEARKAQGMHVLRLSPGCPCCSSKLVLTTHLARTLRLNQPEVLLLELETQAHPSEVLKTLSDPQWTPWFADISIVEG